MSNILETHYHDSKETVIKWLEAIRQTRLYTLHFTQHDDFDKLVDNHPNSEEIMEKWRSVGVNSKLVLDLDQCNQNSYSMVLNRQLLDAFYGFECDDSVDQISIWVDHYVDHYHTFSNYLTFDTTQTKKVIFNEPLLILLSVFKNFEIKLVFKNNNPSKTPLQIFGVMVENEKRWRIMSSSCNVEWVFTNVVPSEFESILTSKWFNTTRIVYRQGLVSSC